MEIKGTLSEKNNVSNISFQSPNSLNPLHSLSTTNNSIVGKCTPLRKEERKKEEIGQITPNRRKYHLKIRKKKEEEEHLLKGEQKIDRFLIGRGQKIITPKRKKIEEETDKQEENVEMYRKKLRYGEELPKDLSEIMKGKVKGLLSNFANRKEENTGKKCHRKKRNSEKGSK